MGKKIIVIKNNIMVLILLIAIIFFICSLIYKPKKNKENIKENTKILKQEITNENTNLKKIVPKRVLPYEVEGFEIIGQIEIPKIDLNTFILSHTNKESLEISVTKLCGPNINEAGNFCIIGHNFNKTKMFKNIKKLELNDTIFLTNVYGQKIEYLVYDIYTVYPNEVECLTQETYGNREVTLITCTTGALKRLIIKLAEKYD